MRPWIFLSAALLLATGCDDDVPPLADDDDGESTGGNTPDPTITTTLPPTGDPTNPDPTDPDPTGDESSSGGEPTTGEPTTGEPTTGEPTTGDESSSGGSSSSGGEPCELLDCDGACIDPDTDPNFCGATACEGKDAGDVCSGSASCSEGACVETCVNCSFEDGDFTGWTVSDVDAPFSPAAVVADGDLPLGDDFFEFGIVTATDGASLGYHGFDGAGPGSIEFGQNLSIREGATTLEFDYRIAWDMITFATGTEDRLFEVHIEPEDGGEPMETVLIDTATNGEIGDSGVVGGSVDVSAYAGQTVFVNFVWNVPEENTGPAQAELDNVRVLAE